MPFYRHLGKIPHKRHTVFRQPNGELYHEQLFGTIGFDGMSSLLYHLQPPTKVNEILGKKDISPVIEVDKNMQMRAFKGFDVPEINDLIDSRIPVLTNSDVTLHLSRPTNLTENYFYKNVDADEVIFIHEGKGKLRTQVGNIDFSYGDYLVIPRGMIYQMSFENVNNRHFIIESSHPIYTPKRYRNWFGQLLEHSPFCERDLRTPEGLETHDEKGEFIVKIKKEGILYDYSYASHPFDVIGWDGYNYPYAFSIHDFEPITGRVHQPPPVHQTFETSAFVICSFCPRLYDYHPEAIPAPYNHSNIDSDEVLYYVDGDFMSRNDISKGKLHCIRQEYHMGLIRELMKEVLVKQKQKSLRLWWIRLKPLKLTKQAVEIEVKDYYKSWIH